MRGSSAIAFALTTATGVMVNWLSSLYQPALVPVLVVSVVVFWAVTAYEKQVESTGRSNSGAAIRRRWPDPIRFTFLSFTFAIVLTWIVEWIYYWLSWDFTISPPFRIGPPNQFISVRELTVGSLLTLIAIVATLRRRPAVDIICFIVPGLAGMALTFEVGPIQHIFSEFNATGTFLGWVCFSGAILLTVAMRSDIRRMIRFFVRGEPEDKASNSGDSGRGP